MILKEPVMANRQSEEGWRCRKLVKPLRKKVGSVERQANRQSNGKLAIRLPG